VDLTNLVPYFLFVQFSTPIIQKDSIWSSLLVGINIISVQDMCQAVEFLIFSLIFKFVSINL